MPKLCIMLAVLRDWLLFLIIRNSWWDFLIRGLTLYLHLVARVSGISRSISDERCAHAWPFGQGFSLFLAFAFTFQASLVMNMDAVFSGAVMQFQKYVVFFNVCIGEKRAGKSGPTKVVPWKLLSYPGMVIYFIYTAPHPKMEVGIKKGGFSLLYEL